MKKRIYLFTTFLALGIIFVLKPIVAQEPVEKEKKVIIEKVYEDKDGKIVRKKVIKDGKEVEHINIRRDGGDEREIEVKVEVQDGKVIIHKIVDGEETIDEIDIEDMEGLQNLHFGDEGGNAKVMIFSGDPKPLLGIIPESTEKGVLVNEVIEGSGAEKAGIVEGDIITAFEGQKVMESDQLIELIAEHEAGDAVKLVVLRNGKSMDMTATLGKSRQEGNTFMRKWNDGEHEFDFDFDTDGNYAFFGDGEDKPFLGIEMDDNEEGMVVLTNIIEDSGAEKAGLLKGDRLVKIDGKPIESFDQVVEVIGDKEVGDKIEIVYERDGNSKTTTATLGKKQSKTWTIMEDFDHEDMKGMQFLKEHDFAKAFAFGKAGFLGVEMEEGEQGVVVSGVVEESAAEEAGIKKGDILKRIDGESVESTGDAIRLIGDKEAGEEVEIEVERDGQTKMIKAELGKRSFTFEFKDGEHGLHGLHELHNLHELHDLKDNIIIELHEGMKGMHDEGAPHDLHFFRDQDSGGNSLHLSDYNAFPNPASSELNLAFSAEEGIPVDITIADVNGKEVYRKKIRKFDGSYSNEINISKGSSGPMLLLIRQGNKVFTDKIMKQ